MIPLNARQEDITNIRRQYNLDQPWPVQYSLFMSRAVRGDMGESFRYRIPALPLVLGRLPNTILLAVVSLLFTALISK